MLTALESPARHRQERSAEAPSELVTLDQVRQRLQVVRALEEARYERARIERQQLARVDRPPTIEQALASARKEIRARISEVTQFTPAERVHLARLMKEQQSWNPFVRNAAKKETQKLHAEQRTRYEAEVAKATQCFESGDAQRMEQRVRSDERIYRDYVSASLGLEDQMRQARAALHDEIPKLETRLMVLERAGVAQLNCDGPAWDASFDQLSASVDRGYRTVPEVLRRDVEFAIRKEQRALNRTRSISMDR